MMRCPIQQKNGIILCTGAIGDCLLTLHLAASVKETYGLDRLDFIGNMDTINFYPDRTCIDRVCSVESIPLHRLFSEPSEFFLDDNDRLSDAFSDYEQVISFLGAGHPDFETNLLFTVHCTHSADVTVLPAKAPDDYPGHITDFYLHCFRQENHLPELTVPEDRLITALPSDYAAGMEIVGQTGLNPDAPLALIQPGSGSPDKCWHVDNFLQVAKVLKKEVVQVLFLMGPAETERFSDGSLIAIRSQEAILENISLTQVLQVLTQADIFLGNDSGIGHLAAGMAKKTIIVFGPSNDIHYRPLGPAVTVHRPANFTSPDQAEQQIVIQTALKML